MNLKICTWNKKKRKKEQMRWGAEEKLEQIKTVKVNRHVSKHLLNTASSCKIHYFSSLPRIIPRNKEE